MLRCRAATSSILGSSTSLTAARAERAPESEREPVTEVTVAAGRRSRTKKRPTTQAALLALGAMAFAGCSVIVDAELSHKADAGGGVDSGDVDAGRDSGTPVDSGSPADRDSCTPTPEACDGVSNDCDDQIDEGATCALPNAVTECVIGDCQITRCDPGHLDCDATAPGCEARDGSHERCGSCTRRCGPAEECAGATASCVERAVGWFRQIENPSDEFLYWAELGVDASGRSYLGLTNGGPLRIDGVTAATPAATAVGLDGDGGLSWITTVQVSGRVWMNAIDAANAGGAVFAGQTNPSGNSDVLLWQRHAGTSMISRGPSAEQAAFIGIVDAGGVPQELHLITAPAAGGFSGLTVDDVDVVGGRIYIAGSHGGSAWTHESSGADVSGPVWVARTGMSFPSSIAFNRYGGGGSLNSIRIAGTGLGGNDAVITGYMEGDFEVGDRSFSTPGFAHVIFRVRHGGAAGTVLWAHMFPLTGGSTEETPAAPVFDSEGNIYVNGECASETCAFEGDVTVDAGDFIASWTAEGEFRFVRSLQNRGWGSFVGADDELALGVTIRDGDDMGGGPFSTLGASRDAALAVWDVTGSYRWGFRLGGGLADSGDALDRDPFGRHFMGGVFRGLVMVGGASATAVGSGRGDAYVVRIDPP